ncbi:hypothetical protein DFJ63DRAFT_230382 [Scheffersomyces coipomensis]|uniref:uncharacterized protein n=1 Tax=Scheffersomyces coipomensis TaxID=1788519 RepID=UPI00315C62A2
MKLLGEEEKQAHIAHITSEGLKGLFYGSILSVGIFTYLKKRHTVRFNSFNTSIKTALIVMPTVSMGAFFADQGSWDFDKQMHSSEYSEKLVIEEYRQWNEMALNEKIFTSLNKNKYPIIISAWAASLYGSWVLVNKDKIMTGAQKAVQARMYAQGITIILLLGTIVLSMKEKELEKSRPPPVPEWKRIIDEKQAEESLILAELKKKQDARSAAATTAVAAASTPATAAEQK